MELAEMQALLEAQQAAFLKALDTRDEAINARLKAFEDAPALKASGFVTQDGGKSDPAIKNFADFLKAVQRRDHARLSSVYATGYQEYSGDAVKALSGGDGASGGFAVPVTYENEISKIEATIAFFEPLAFPMRMTSDTHKFTMLRQTSNPSSSGVGASGYFGGMYFNMGSEGGTIADRSPEFTQGTLQARKLTGLTVASSEIREDAPQIERELMMLFAEGLATAKQYLFLHHNGVSGPLGALHASNPARLLVTRTASGNDIEIGDVTAMMSRMIPSLAGNAIFIAHPYSIDDLMQLSLVSNGDPAFTAANGPPGSPLLGTLINKPVYSSEFMALPGTAGDLAYVAPRAYAVGTRSGILIQGSEHVRFDSDQYTWRVTTRLDGQPRLDGTIKLADGSNSEVSAFVVLS